MRCKYCGSESLHSAEEKKGFSTGKAIAGTIAFGAIGAVAGVTGKNVKGWRCGACGAFMENPMDHFTEQCVNDAIFEAKKGSSWSQYTYYKQQYPNIETVQVEKKETVYQKTSDILEGAHTASVLKNEQSLIEKRSYDYGLWIPSCPVVIKTVHLKSDGSEDAVSFDIVNQSEKTIRSLYLQVTAYDDTGDLLTNNKCVYQQSSVEPGKMFPQDRTFGLGTDLAFNLDIVCEKAAFEDGEVWRSDGESAIQIQPGVKLDIDKFPRYKYLEEAYRTEQKQAGLGSLISPVVIPEKRDAYWLCTCGIPVQGEKCPQCGCTYERIQTIFSQQFLQEEQINAVKKRAAERAQKTMAARQKLDDIENEKSYSKALQLLARDSLDDLRKAEKAFEKIRLYKDSEQKLAQCTTRINEIEEEQYQKAVSIVDKAESLSDCLWAKKTLELLGEHRESKVYLDKCQKEISRLQDEKRQKDEQERQHLRAEAERKAKKKKRTIILIIAALLACAAAAFMVFKVFIPNGKYNDAVALMENGQYEEAIAAFEAMNGYKDSTAQIENCRNGIKDREYDVAVALMNEGKYEEAITAFEAMNGYKDSAKQIENCQTRIKERQYQAAMSLMEEENYAEAIDILVELGDYSESNNKITECRYLMAIKLLKEEDFFTAATEFSNIIEYKDSNKQMEEAYLKALSKALLETPLNTELLASIPDKYYVQDSQASYIVAKAFFEKEKWDSAKKYFEFCGDYEETKNYLIYITSRIEMESKDWRAAQKHFASISGFLDADEMFGRAVYGEINTASSMTLKEAISLLSSVPKLDEKGKERYQLYRELQTCEGTYVAYQVEDYKTGKKEAYPNTGEFKNHRLTYITSFYIKHGSAYAKIDGLQDGMVKQEDGKYPFVVNTVRVSDYATVHISKSEIKAEVGGYRWDIVYLKRQ